VTRRRPPAPLILLLAATLLIGLVWTFVVPPFQAPDEPAHVSYVQSIAERGALPGAASRPSYSTEQLDAAEAANSDQTAAVPETKPTWSADAYDRWRQRSAGFPESARTDGGGPNFASSNPPLYYVLSVAPYRLAAGGDVFARVTAMRIGSVVFLLVTVVATWLLAGTVFGPRRDLQLAAAAVPALLPMVDFISASVSPDSLLYALWTVGLWLGARVLRGRGGPVDLVALIAIAGMAVATKATSYAFAVPVAFVLGVELWRLRHRRRLVLAVAAAGVAAIVLTAGAWFVVAGSSDRPAAAQLTDALNVPEGGSLSGLGSYMWQFYLPRLSFMRPFGGHEGWPPPVWDVWIVYGWGAFGWLEVQWPQPVYWVLALLATAVAVAAIAVLVRWRARVDLTLLAFFAIAALALLAGLHWNEYKLATEQGTLVNQGRYLFPLVGLAGLAAATALWPLRARPRATAMGLLVGGLAVLDVYAIALVATRFYA
jgi:4-amino-4-deoxy-L-arabinose transferase-like glycosyltransferase